MWQFWMTEVQTVTIFHKLDCYYIVRLWSIITIQMMTTIMIFFWFLIFNLFFSVVYRREARSLWPASSLAIHLNSLFYVYFYLRCLSVMRSFVCLSVCVQDFRKSNQLISLKFGVMIGPTSCKKLLTFGGDW